jgi:hypothetical protein
MDIKRRLIWATVIILVLWVATYAITKAPTTTPQTLSNTAAGAPNVDLADITYNIAGTSYVLSDGVAAIAEPNSSTQDMLRLYQATRGSLNGDGEQDAAAILINEPGGSGTFYYLAVAFANGSTTPAVLLGDRIETDSVAIQNGNVIVRYKDRAASQPFSIAPTVNEIAMYSVVNGALVRE